VHPIDCARTIDDMYGGGGGLLRAQPEG